MQADYHILKEKLGNLGPLLLDSRLIIGGV